MSFGPLISRFSLGWVLHSGDAQKLLRSFLTAHGVESFTSGQLDLSPLIERFSAPNSYGLALVHEVEDLKASS